MNNNKNRYDGERRSSATSFFAVPRRRRCMSQVSEFRVESDRSCSGILWFPRRGNRYNASKRKKAPAMLRRREALDPWRLGFFVNRKKTLVQTLISFYSFLACSAYRYMLAFILFYLPNE